MIEFENVSFSYGKKKILHGLSFKAEDGKCLCLTGESGCGKSTAVKIAAGLLKADGGTVKTHDKISVVFQNDRLIPHLTVVENVTFCTPDADKDKIDRLLFRLRLSDAANKKPSELSGGEARRVSIIRAVIFGGDALILDEPFNGLDHELKSISADIIKEEFLYKGKPVLMISHSDEDSKLLSAENLTIVKQR